MFEFNRELILNEEVNKENFNQLIYHLRKNTIIDFNKWDWLANIFNEILCYEMNGYSKPTGILNELFKLKEFYNYKGLIFRGYKVINKQDLRFETENVCSWSTKLANAEIFAEDADNEGFESIVIETYVEDALDLSGLLIEFLENYMDKEIYSEFEVFLGEDEILHPVKNFKFR